MEDHFGFRNQVVCSVPLLECHPPERGLVQDQERLERYRGWLSNTAAVLKLKHRRGKAEELPRNIQFRVNSLPSPPPAYKRAEQAPKHRCSTWLRSFSLSLSTRLERPGASRPSPSRAGAHPQSAGVSLDPPGDFLQGAWLCRTEAPPLSLQRITATVQAYQVLPPCCRLHSQLDTGNRKVNMTHA